MRLGCESADSLAESAPKLEVCVSDGKRDNGNGNGRGAAPQEAVERPLAGHRAFERLGELLEQDGWYPQPLGDKPVYRVQYAGKNGSFPCYLQVRLELEQLLIYAVCPVRIPEQTRAPVAEFVTRANYGLRIGNFELDYSDGEVRYKTSLDFEGENLSFNLLRGLLYPAVHTLDLYLPGLLAVGHGEKTALEAIVAIEGEDE
jgi:hypothetical protein